MKKTRNQLEGKVALITGGASGIGLATAARYVNEGAKVVIADLNSDLMGDAKKQLGDACATIETNVTNESDVEHAVAYATKEFGRLDIGVNSAGLGTYALITDQTEEQFDTVINTCLKGVFFSMKHQGRQMITQGGGGVIINISSLSSQQPGEGQSAYCSAKAAVNMITSVGAMEMGPHNIRVCGIAPGLVYTPLTEVIKETSALNEAYLENTPLGRAGIPEDIANSALYLASDESSWVSGITLTVDGAAHTKRYPELPKIFAALSDENA
jgi:NAD(P)-dependent dehydrogenase (short-subunit alcohol dehydrogenase family)